MAPQQEQTQILVVDDDARVLDTFSRNLSLAGYPVITASNGQAALESYREAHPDITLVDVRMPYMDGFEVLRAIRERDPEAEVILVTGHGDMEMAIEALREGASDFIPKPVEQSTLNAALRHAKERLRLKRELREAQAALRHAHDELEIRVQRRTAELSEANRQLEAQIAERRRAEQKLQISHNHQSALNALLRISVNTPESTLNEQLNQALDHILSISWLPLLPKGAIFLTDEKGQGHTLLLKASRGFDVELRMGCQNLPIGECLCGQAVSEKRMLFASNLDERHKKPGPDLTMAPHGHYCVPILSGEIPLGVLTLYLEPGHEREDHEIAFLNSVAHTLASIIERKRAEEALRKSQHQYAGLVNTIDGIVWEADAATQQFTFVSPQAEEMLGYPLARWTEEPDFWPRHIHEEDRETSIEFCAKATRQKRDHEFEYRMIDAEGNIVWLRDIASVIVEDGQPVKLRGVMIDITERKRLTERLVAIHQLGQEMTLLRDEQALVKRTLQTAVQVIDFSLAGFGVVDERQQELVRRFHIIDGEFTVSPTQRIPIDEDASICAAATGQGQTVNVPDTSQDPRYLIPLEDGPRYLSELCVPIKIEDRVLGVINAEHEARGHFTLADQQLLQTLADQTAVAMENARLYAKIQRNARELAALNSATHAMASNLDLDTVLKQVIQEVNVLLETEDASVLLYDSAADELVFSALANPDYQMLIGHRLSAKEGIAGQVMQHQEPILIADAQDHRSFYRGIDEVTGLTTRSLIAVPLMGKGQVIGVIEVINKIHGTFNAHDLEILKAFSSSAAISLENARLYRKQQEQIEELRATQAKLVQSEKMSALGRLIASISHEINNPLQSIQGCLTLADEEIDSDQRPGKLRRYLGVAEDEIERIAAIVRRVRDFYRPAREDLNRVDVHTVLESVLELSGKQLQHSDVVIDKHWAEDLPPIPANAAHLKQVFLNLVLNAIDAMPSGGTLSLRTAREDEMVLIEFTDTGVGMSEKTQDRLFEPFFTTKPHGSGLGLSISYGIIEAHDGQILVRSEVGKGSTFSLLLPIEVD
ncbi:MAG: GAF domain-containing protein [Chloroflexi bacterium]|jgi:two-component system NtrC family sensor kinase|nr:GAF domain-containing protein [Chloroflexota bacterium]